MRSGNANNLPVQDVDRGTMLKMTVAFEGGLLVVAVIAGFFLKIPLWNQAHFDILDLAIGVGISIPLALVALLIAKHPVAPFRQVRKDFELVVSLFKNSTTGDLVLISLMAGLAEEALFRGVMQPFVAGYTGQVWAVLIVSILFGLAHAISVTYIFFAGLISVALGALYIWTDNLIAPMAAHACYDAFALIYAVRSGIFAGSASRNAS